MVLSYSPALGMEGSASSLSSAQMPSLEIGKGTRGWQETATRIHIRRGMGKLLG